MKIGMLLPTNYAIGNPFNGVREQAKSQAKALELLGHDVVRMSAWSRYDIESFDVVQFYFGGHWMNSIEKLHLPENVAVVYSPIIDTLQSNKAIRIATLLGNIHPKFISLQEQYRRQCERSDMVVARSSFEKDKLVNGLGVDVAKVQIVLNGCDVEEAGDSSLCRNKWNLPENFVLHISRYTNKSKNVLNMIRGVGRLDMPLVIAGTSDQSPYLSLIHI